MKQRAHVNSRKLGLRVGSLLVLAIAFGCSGSDAPDAVSESAPAAEAETSRPARLPGILDAPAQQVRISAPDDGTSSGTYVVPETDTAAEIKPSLRRYDAHLARMVALTVDWCEGRSSESTIDWRFWSENGAVFLGAVPLSCQIAGSLFAEVGPGEEETLPVAFGAESDSIQLTLPAVETLAQVTRLRAAFQAAVSIYCADELCPGARVR